MKYLVSLALLSLGFIFIRCGSNDQPNPEETTSVTTPSIAFTVVGSTPHDTSFFTEGLEFYKGALLESTGLKEESRLIAYDLQSGKIDKEVKLDSIYFGEGISVFRDTLYQLTYQESVV